MNEPEPEQFDPDECRCERAHEDVCPFYDLEPDDLNDSDDWSYEP